MRRSPSGTISGIWQCVSERQTTLMGMRFAGKEGEERSTEIKRCSVRRRNLGGERRKRYKRDGGSNGDGGAKGENMATVYYRFM